MTYTINPNAKDVWIRDNEDTMDLSPITDASTVYLENGRTIEQELGEGSMVSNVATVDTSMNKVIDGTLDGAYESCLLRGNTKFIDNDTGEVLDTFEEGRNLSLVDVKMPILRNVGKNLIDDTVLKIANLGEVIITDTVPIKVEPNKSYYVELTLQGGIEASMKYFTIEYKDENGIVVTAKYHNHVVSFTEEQAQKIKTINVFTNKQHGYSSVFVEHLWE